MNIGELMLHIGISGAEKTVGAISNVTKGLGDTASMSLEAKAGIIAATYALERLFAVSGHAGTALTNFNAVTGMSAQALQQYQYAARQVGVSNEAVEASFKNLQKVSAKILLGEGAPKGLARISQLVKGGITSQDINNFAQNSEGFLLKIQEYGQKEKNIALRNEVINSLGLGEEINAAIARNAFTPEILQRAPRYSATEIPALDKSRAAWANLGFQIQMAIGHFNALHGIQIVHDLSTLTTQVTRLIEAFIKLSDALHLFKGITMIFEGWAKIFDIITSGVSEVSKVINKPTSQNIQKLGSNVANVGENSFWYLISLADQIGKKIAEVISPSKKPLSEVLKSFVESDNRNKTEKINDLSTETSKLITGLTTYLQTNVSKTNHQSGTPGSIKSENNDSLPVGQSQGSNGLTPETLHHGISAILKSGLNALTTSPEAYVDPTSINNKIGSDKVINNNVNQNLNFHHDGKDAKKTGDSVKQAIKEAFRQSPVLGQAT